MAYTREGVLAQMFVAFGQGTGAVRVSRGACAAFYGRYAPWIDETILAVWETEAVQILERVRAVGRRLAFDAGLAGRTAIAGEQVAAAARAVEEGEGCPWCPAQAEKAGRPIPAAEATPRDAILGQMLVAFGQGTGTMRVSHEACAAFRARYEGWIDGRIEAVWEAAAVQILERVRAIGRLLATRASLAGSTAIAGAGVAGAARQVEKAEDCPYCPIHREEAALALRSAAAARPEAELPVV